MAFWEELNSGIKSSTKQWVDWARRHAQDVGEAGVRHIERQDLLRERRQMALRLGEYAVDRFLHENRKTIRSDAAEIEEVLTRLREIEARLEELRSDESEDSDRGGAATDSDAPSD